jgi:hypothetical protein
MNPSDVTSARAFDPGVLARDGELTPGNVDESASQPARLGTLKFSGEQAE